MVAIGNRVPVNPVFIASPFSSPTRFFRTEFFPKYYLDATNKTPKCIDLSYTLAVVRIITTMDLKWTPMSSRPAKLYRVCSPWQRTEFSRRGFVATDCTLFFGWETHYPEFIKSIEDHRFNKRKPSPYISFFEDLREAEEWCLAGEEWLRQPCRVIEIDMTHSDMQTIPGWRVRDIQDKSDELLGGTKNSEWLMLWYIPVGPFVVPFRNGTDIRRGECFSSNG